MLEPGAPPQCHQLVPVPEASRVSGWGSLKIAMASRELRQEGNRVDRGRVLSLLSPAPTVATAVGTSTAVLPTTWARS